MLRQQADDPIANAMLLRQLYPQPPAFGRAADLRDALIPPPSPLKRSRESDVIAPLCMEPAELEYWTALVNSRMAEAQATAAAAANVEPMVDYSWWEQDEEDWDVYDSDPQTEEEFYATLAMMTDETTDEDPYSFLTAEEYEEYVLDRAMSL
jgi:hypothetical protein